jgi:hypothetical protein
MSTSTTVHPYAVFYPRSKIELSDTEIDKMNAATSFLRGFNPLEVSDIELEYIVMHTAFMVNDLNGFSNNYNVSNKEKFLDLMAETLTSDINTWSRRLYESGFWTFDNFAIVNLIWNWLNGSLVAPTSFL